MIQDGNSDRSWQEGSPGRFQPPGGAVFNEGSTRVSRRRRGVLTSLCKEFLGLRPSSREFRLCMNPEWSLSPEGICCCRSRGSNWGDHDRSKSPPRPARPWKNDIHRWVVHQIISRPWSEVDHCPPGRLGERGRGRKLRGFQPAGCDCLTRAPGRTRMEFANGRRVWKTTIPWRGNAGRLSGPAGGTGWSHSPERPPG